MKTTSRKRRATKTGRRAGRITTAQSLQTNAESAMRRGRDTISRAYDWAHETAGNVDLSSLRMPRRRDIAHLAEANPLLLGAVGLGLGVAIATLFPRGMSRPTRARAANGSEPPVRSPVRRRRKARRNAKAKANVAAAS